MKCVFILLIGFVSNFLAYSNEVTYEVSPKEPVINESFFITFRVKASGDKEPYITFTPSGLQVLGKREQGVSIQTVVINGKFTSTKELNIVYELISDRSGTAYLRNIKVDVGGVVSTVRDISINVLSAPKKIPDVFMETEVSKTKVYLGEGIDVNYYLYFKNNVAAQDIKDFPKLNKFIKRFHHINSPPETVQYKSEVMRRILVYSARVYPEKIGNLMIDPMKIAVQVVDIDYNGISGFGFGTQKIRNKDVLSNKVEIEVQPLPSEGVPTNFTGLVGEHEFIFSPGKEKYLVNEPIELKLEVKGVGALEKMEAPVFYSDPNLESFDTKAEVTEIGNSSVKKIFEYTYLARSNLNIPEREFGLSYFDPANGKYVEKKFKVPSLVISGIAPLAKNETKIDNKKVEKGPYEFNFNFGMLGNIFGNLFKTSEIKKGQGGDIQLVGPILKSDIFENVYLRYNLFLFFIFLIAAFFVLRERFLGSEIYGSSKEVQAIYKKIKKNGLQYSELFNLLSRLDKDNQMMLKGIGMDLIIAESSLSKDAKRYFKLTLDQCEKIKFKGESAEAAPRFERKFFEELLRLL